MLRKRGQGERGWLGRPEECHSGLHQVMPSRLEGKIAALLDSVLGQTCTAAVCLVTEGGREICSVAVGSTDPDAGEAVSVDTPFDLASLTKLFTGTAALRLIASGELALDAPVQRYVPEFRGSGKEAVRVEHLLTHTSGLPPGPMLFGPDAPADPRAALLRVPLVEVPGLIVVYSDTGFMVLGLAIEAVTGQRLDAAIDALVSVPLGLRCTGFGPRPEAVATEWDEQRGRRIRGRVHDENAGALGGVAGHAGVFGPAGDVLALVRAFAEREASFLPTELVTAATTELAVTGAERRGLAWKLRSPSPDAPEHAFSPDTFGHYGFTGTAVWHDPWRGGTVVLLTNRVYFGREPGPIHRLRRELFALVAGAIPCRLSGDGPAA